MDQETVLKLKDVDKFFNDFVAVDRINLDVKDGEFFTIVGPSGSGKTTMIRMLVGMDKPTNGEISLRGKVINDVPANKRPTCMVFQSLALFPHKTVGENIEFPMKIKGELKNYRKARAIELLEQLHLSESYYDKMITECSGGERQRVALARALAFDPEILFFDEPLSALDYRLRKTLEKELKDIQRKTGKTFIYITHSLEEAMVMSDRIGIMRRGRLIQVGTPEEIYNSPVNGFVAQFMGEVNQFEVDVRGDELADSKMLATYRSPNPAYDNSSGILIVRPEDMRLLSPEDTAENELEGTLVNQYSLGSRTQYQVMVNGKTLLVEMLGAGVDVSEGDEVKVGWSTDSAILLKE
ncbi:Fe3+/spermidine/putrescine ABC transporter ATP-binding protein [Thiomicrospira sp. XS5]|jgi:spermidine/putrescine transport system ATP-binding protein|uniref:ABC transporter ATP-binding protein n=1 Tax=unclassified Thiomicrospira TaxID=2643099 RepID=UPI0004A7803C|nr:MULTISPECIES: ABC transporter ATP-binding protein [unclassified Thiomicrospira]AZR81392.1 Fe3+/spermidine/putrescine ABC transporter ATP-binding protein [Thiomicrospira sp. S5]AZR81561.1 Fe3+/spermidine/putrescine ABC transporter ATP-binding protein [Thiomicrospira sp. S5]KUJ76097.1 Fe3+/spermidine/putrescine ABC transporter ATP-binding protein [Thiomicrospira sp. XS5]